MRIKSFDIPQADRLESVVQLIINVGSGAKTDLQIIKSIPYLTTDRQGRYYRKAAEILGFITNRRNSAEITEKGLSFLKNPSVNNPILISSILSIEVIQRLLPYMELHKEGLTKKEIEYYLASIMKIKEAKENISAYFHFYNTKRLHQSLNYKTPAEIYFKRNELKNIKIFRQANENIHLNLPNYCRRSFRSHRHFNDTETSHDSLVMAENN